MKKLLTILTGLAIVLQVAAQQSNKPVVKTEQKTDVLLKTNGDELLGKVTEINDADVKFSYEGEALVYSIKKTEILKITFASGRIEFFNRPTTPAPENSNEQSEKKSTNTGLAEHHNKVAILPFGFIKDNQDAGEEMRYKVQSDVYTFLNKHSAGLTILDPRSTNALLAKGGVSRDNLMNYTMDEICNILGVEYVVEGTVSQNKGMATTTTYGNYNSDKKKDGDTRGSIYGSSMSAQRYVMKVSVNIYTNKDTNIYSQNRTGMLTTIDGSYSSPMEYLLKRCPLYRK